MNKKKYIKSAEKVKKIIFPKPSERIYQITEERYGTDDTMCLIEKSVLAIILFLDEQDDKRE